MLSPALLRLRVRVQRLLRFTESHSMLLWAAIVGFLGALSTLAFRQSIYGLERLIASSAGVGWHGKSLVELATLLPWYWRALLPAAGGVVAGAFLLLARRVPASAPSDYMEAIAIGDGNIPIRQSLLRSASSLFTIGSGGSIGREGSMVHLAAMCASIIGRIAHFDPPRLRLLVACGAAAGITAAYNAPIAGAFFVTEIVLGAIVMDSFGPIVVASVIANITMHSVPGYQPTYEMPPFPPIIGAEIALFVVVGVLAGLLAPQFLRLLNASRQRFQTLPVPLPARLALGGLAVGVLSIWVPQVWGNGYSVVNGLLHQPLAWTMVLSILLFKIIATALTAGSGAVGGVFTPMLFVGAAVGWLFGAAAHGIWPAATSAPFVYAMIGMGAFLAAATSAPLMAILMIFEMTLSYEAVLPLMLSCVVAYFVARAVDDTSMYDVTIKRNRDAKERMRLQGTRMRDLIKPADTVLREDAPFGDVTQMFLKYPVKYIYIVDAAGLYRGVVALQDLAARLEGGGSASAAPPQSAADVMRPGFLAAITPDMSLAEALQHFLAHQGERLPVVQSSQQPVLLGVVYKSSLLDAYFRLNSG